MASSVPGKDSLQNNMTNSQAGIETEPETEISAKTGKSIIGRVEGILASPVQPQDENTSVDPVFARMNQDFVDDSQPPEPETPRKNSSKSGTKLGNEKLTKNGPKCVNLGDIFHFTNSTR